MSLLLQLSLGLCKLMRARGAAACLCVSAMRRLTQDRVPATLEMASGQCSVVTHCTSGDE